MPKNLTSDGTYTDPVIIPVDGEPMVIHGPGGTGTERAWQALTNRTGWLKENIDAVIAAGIAGALTADRHYYVSPSGNDQNDGLAVSRPWRTIEHAWHEILRRVNLNGFNAYINLAAGTYPGTGIGGVIQGAELWESQVILQGVQANPTAVILDGGTRSALAVGEGASIMLRDLVIQAPGVGGHGIFTGTAGTAVVDRGVSFGPTDGQHMRSWSGGMIYSYGPYSITGRAGQGHHGAESGGIINSGGTVTIPTTNLFLNYYSWARGLGKIDYGQTTWTGAGVSSVVAYKYFASLNSVIGTAPKPTNPNLLPGDKPGILETGGQYW